MGILFSRVLADQPGCFGTHAKPVSMILPSPIEAGARDRGRTSLFHQHLGTLLYEIQQAIPKRLVSQIPTSSQRCHRRFGKVSSIVRRPFFQVFHISPPSPSPSVLCEFKGSKHPLAHHPCLAFAASIGRQAASFVFRQLPLHSPGQPRSCRIEVNVVRHYPEL